MKRLALLVALATCLPVLAACSSCPSNTRVAAAPVKPSRVYTPPCKGGNYARPADDEVYTPSDCNPFLILGAQISETKCPFRGMGIPGLDCPSPAPTFALEAPQVAAAPPTCDPTSLPKDAKPGDVFCCTFVQPPAGPPVKVAEARAEWQKVDCGDGNLDCWRLVETPPVFSAPSPPPGYWEWRLNPDCHVLTVKAAPPLCTPAVKAAPLLPACPDCQR